MRSLVQCAITRQSGDAPTPQIGIRWELLLPRAFDQTCGRPRRRACGFALGTGLDAGGGFLNANHPCVNVMLLRRRGSRPSGDESIRSRATGSRRRRDARRPPASVRLACGRIGHNLFTDSAHAASVAFMNSHASVPITAAKLPNAHISLSRDNRDVSRDVRLALRVPSAFAVGPELAVVVSVRCYPNQLSSPVCLGALRHHIAAIQQQ